MFGFRSSFSAPSGLRGAHRAPSLPKPTGTEIVPAELYEAHEVKSYLRQAQNTWLVRRDGTQQRRHIPDACRAATLELDRAPGSTHARNWPMHWPIAPY